MKLSILHLWLLIILSTLIACTTQDQSTENKPQTPNVLFIAVDDLRPELNCYGQSKIHSPNLDQLAKEGFLFERAYCNIPVCGASRASILTGIRPRPDRFLDFSTWADEDAPEALSLPQRFKQQGYHTLSMGKVFHHRNDKSDSWSELPWHPGMDQKTGASWRNYLLPENIQMDSDDDPTRGPAYEKAAVADTAYFDGKIANRAMQKLQQFAASDQAFFMAVGFVKPHLPFNAPAKYWDLYDPETISLPERMDYPKDAPSQSHHSSGELRHYHGIPKKGAVADTTAQKLIHGYYASVSYVDAMIGRVLEELKRLELDENTIVVLWGDHGWSLGDHGLWCKHSTFNVAMQTPLFLKVPGRKGGQRISALTELVDLYPSLCELAGLSKPDHLQGDSFVPLLDDPSTAGKDALFCRWKKSDAIKTDRYLYTEWFDAQEQSVARMLYDHENDPQESVNIADLPQHQDLVESLSNRLRQQRQID